jgi:hypothetical protein
MLIDLNRKQIGCTENNINGYNFGQGRERQTWTSAVIGKLKQYKVPYSHHFYQPQGDDTLYYAATIYMY